MTTNDKNNDWEVLGQSYAKNFQTIYMQQLQNQLDSELLPSVTLSRQHSLMCHLRIKNARNAFPVLQQLTKGAQQEDVLA